MAAAAANAAASGGSFRTVASMDEAFAGAHAVYPKSWGPWDLMQERVAANRKGDKAAMADIEKRALERNARHRDWICDERRMGLTKDALYLHCLPADIGAEVSPGVMDRFRVDVAREANKKVYVIMALLAAAKVRRPRRPPRGPRLTGVAHAHSRREDRRPRRALPSARRPHPARGDPHPCRPRGPAGRGGRGPPLRPQQPRGAADGVPEADRRRGGRGAPAGGRGLRRLRQPRLDRAGREGRDPRPRQEGRLHGRPRRHGEGAAPAVAGEDERWRSTPTTASSTSPASTGRRCAGSSATCRRTTSGSTFSSAAASADQLAGVVSQIVATKILLELAPEGALRGVDRPLVRARPPRRTTTGAVPST